MINYYTKRKYIPKDKKFINAVDMFFDSWVIEHGLDITDNTVINAIDKSKLGPTVNTIITPYGVGEYSNISTGAKAALLLKNLGQEFVVNIQECGQNAIDFIFLNMDNINVFSDKYKALPTLDRVDVLVNNKKQTLLRDMKKNWE